MVRMMSDSALPAAPSFPARPRPAPWWRLAGRQFVRDFAAGELRLLALAVTLAVAALAAVGFFADRIEGGLARDARQLLGGDALVGSDQPAPPEVAERARALGLRVATSAAFPSMARAPDDKGGAAKLVAVKSVSADYPLRGRLQVRAGLDAPLRAVAAGPAPGEVWVDRSVLDALGLAVGDRLLLGDAALRIAQVIVVEPDRGAGFLSFAPRVMLSDADLPATGLVQPASRVGWRLAVAAPPGAEAAVQRFADWTRARIAQQKWRGIRVESLETGRPEMRQTMARAQKFLNLVALLAALLAAVAVAIASRDFAGRHLDACAMLRVLGSSQRTIALAYFGEFVAVGLLASLAGVALGFAVHHVFVWLLAGLVAVDLPAPGPWPAFFGVGVGFTLLLGFGLPPVMQLARVPPLRVIRRDMGDLKPASAAVLGAGALGFAALLLAVASDVKLGLIAVGGFAAALGVFAAAAWLAVQVLRRAVPGAGTARWWTFGAAAPAWLVLATRQVAARPAFAVLQVSSLSVGLLALVLLVLLRTDLVDNWRQATPADAPDRFVINVQPDQAAAFRAQIDAAGITGYDWYPMFRGRLVAINGRPITSASFAEEGQRRTVEREFNLSHTPAVPPRNAVVAGRWKADEAGAISVEDRLAESLGLGLGDRMRFDVAGTLVEGRITSLRKVEWGSMRANFYVLFPRTRLADVQALPAGGDAGGGNGSEGGREAGGGTGTATGAAADRRRHGAGARAAGQGRARAMPPADAAAVSSADARRRCCRAAAGAAELPATYMAAFRSPAAAGFDNALRAGLSERHRDRRVGVDRPDPARARPGDPRRRVPVRLHPRRRAGGAVRRARRQRARRARASSPSCARSARAARCSAACSAPSCSASARSPACWRRAPRSASAGRWRAGCSSSNGRCGRGYRSPAAPPARCSRSAAGWWGLRDVLRRPVIETLRSAAE